MPRPRDRLLELLREFDVSPDEVVDDAADRVFAARLAACVRARDRFLEVGRDVRPSADVRRMLVHVREPLLDALRVYPDFRSAREPLLALTHCLARVDPAGARQLLAEREGLRPEPGAGLAAVP